MKRIVVYHDTAREARRARPPCEGETVYYRSIEEFNEEENREFDGMENLSSPPARKKKGK